MNFRRKLAKWKGRYHSTHIALSYITMSKKLKGCRIWPLPIHFMHFCGSFTSDMIWKRRKSPKNRATMAISVETVNYLRQVCCYNLIYIYIYIMLCYIVFSSVYSLGLEYRSLQLPGKHAFNVLQTFSNKLWRASLSPNGPLWDRHSEPRVHNPQGVQCEELKNLNLPLHSWQNPLTPTTKVDGESLQSWLAAQLMSSFTP